MSLFKPLAYNVYERNVKKKHLGLSRYFSYFQLIQAILNPVQKMKLKYRYTYISIHHGASPFSSRPHYLLLLHVSVTVITIYTIHTEHTRFAQGNLTQLLLTFFFFVLHLCKCLGFDLYFLGFGFAFLLFSFFSFGGVCVSNCEETSVLSLCFRKPAFQLVDVPVLKKKKKQPKASTKPF